MYNRLTFFICFLKLFITFEKKKSEDNKFVYSFPGFGTELHSMQRRISYG